MNAPGPRCASHLKTSLAKNKERLAAALDSGDEKAFNAADSERATLQFEMAGTRTGQSKLDKRIEEATDPEVRADLQSYKDRARQAYLSKVDALRAVEAQMPAPGAAPAEETPSQRIVRERSAHPVGSYLNPTRESIAAEVAAEVAIQEQLHHEHVAEDAARQEQDRIEQAAEYAAFQARTQDEHAQDAAPDRTSAASYTRKGGKGGKHQPSSPPAPPTPKPTPVAPAPETRTSASSYTRKGGKGGGK